MISKKIAVLVVLVGMIGAMGCGCIGDKTVEQSVPDSKPIITSSPDVGSEVGLYVLESPVGTSSYELLEDGSWAFVVETKTGKRTQAAGNYVMIGTDKVRMLGFGGERILRYTGNELIAKTDDGGEVVYSRTLGSSKPTVSSSSNKGPVGKYVTKGPDTFTYYELMEDSTWEFGIVIGDTEVRSGIGTWELIGTNKICLHSNVMDDQTLGYTGTELIADSFGEEVVYVKT